MLSIGDLAQSLVQKSRQGFLKAQIDRFGQQLTTGLAADPARRLGGDTSRLNGIVGDIARLTLARDLVNEVGIRATSQQTSLETLDTTWSARSADMLRADLMVLPSERALVSARARDAFDASIATLNTQSAGRSIFGGTATDRAPLADPETILASINAALAGASDAADVTARLDNWFDGPTGFATDAYLGSTTSLAPQKLGNGAEVSLGIRADNAAIRAGLKGLVTAMVATDPVLGLAETDQTRLLESAGLRMIEAQGQLSVLRSDLGATEARIETSATRISVELSAVQSLRLSLVGTDPFDDAAKLEAAQFQLESLYTVTLTARRMSFLEAMR
ncbi:flagellar hook-associated protein 3 FlgL [Roseivivax lentus]|uniref:Flagellar hook-associated protein 3 FlgL n=1 Tax=Roseivivax lentus TaxID=633194 RepID=A0A1N7JLR6_9RHOB|nr:flagellin [Roseivivax lentus]SIS50247.1 flagellar hook-associated protein 3 FlgL [Roseivivax lentus]